MTFLKFIPYNNSRDKENKANKRKETNMKINEYHNEIIKAKDEEGLVRIACWALDDNTLTDSEYIAICDHIERKGKRI